MRRNYGERKWRNMVTTQIMIPLYLLLVAQELLVTKAHTRCVRMDRRGIAAGGQQLLLRQDVKLQQLFLVANRLVVLVWRTRKEHHLPMALFLTHGQITPL